MKTVRVVAAVIKSYNVEKQPMVFATQRGYGEFKDRWEFPGGKIEKGETPREALIREIAEELNMKIKVNEIFFTVEYDYSNFHLSMDCFWCEMLDEEFELMEHEDCKWVTKDELEAMDWLPADKQLVATLKKSL